MPLGICGKRGCSKPLSHNKSHAQCILCLRRFHQKCHLPIVVSYNSSDNELICSACREHMFPFNNVKTEDLFELFNINVFKDSIIAKNVNVPSAEKL